MDDLVFQLEDEKICDVIRDTFSQERLKTPFYKSLTRVTVLVPGSITPALLRKLETWGVQSEFKSTVGDTLLYFPRSRLLFYPSRIIDFSLVVVFCSVLYYGILLKL